MAEESSLALSAVRSWLVMSGSGSDAARLGASLAPIARLHEEALAWLEGYTGVAYPFATLDVVITAAEHGHAQAVRHEVAAPE